MRWHALNIVHFGDCSLSVTERSNSTPSQKDGELKASVDESGISIRNRSYIYKSRLLMRKLYSSWWLLNILKPSFFAGGTGFESEPCERWNEVHLSKSVITKKKFKNFSFLFEFSLLLRKWHICVFVFSFEKFCRHFPTPSHSWRSNSSPRRWNRPNAF